MFSSEEVEYLQRLLVTEIKGFKSMGDTAYQRYAAMPKKIWSKLENDSKIEPREDLSPSEMIKFDEVRFLKEGKTVKRFLNVFEGN